MKRYLTVMSQILPWYLKTIFIDKFKLPEPIKLPNKVRKYSFIKNLSLKGFPFGTGLYKDANGKKVVIKIWKRGIKDFHYFNLIHQIEVMRTFTNVQSRISAKGKFGFSTPKYIHSEIRNDKVVLVMERVVGKSMQEVERASDQLKIYKNCISFMKVMSEKLTEKEKKIITTKSVWDFVFLYPLILVTAMFIQPELVGLLLKGIPTIIRGILPLAKLKPDRLVHGDLHPDNIMILGKNKFSLIDLENIRLCYSEYEPITTISLKGNSWDFKQLVIKNFLVPEYGDKDTKKAIELLIVNNSTHNLSGDKSIDGIKSYKKAISLAFN